MNKNVNILLKQIETLWSSKSDTLFTCARFYFIIECNDRKYGDGCQRKCGFCLNMTQCDHVNGTCSQGCEAGYQGQMCEQGQ